MVKKVDVVAHSLGGLVVRKYCKEKRDDCRNQIHKLITLGTPHLGTDFATWFTEKKDTFPSKIVMNNVVGPLFNELNFVYGPGIRDQEVNSSAIQELTGASLPIPMHMVVGQTPDNTWGEEFYLWIWLAMETLYFTVPDESFAEYKIFYDANGQEQLRVPLERLFQPTDVPIDRGRNDRLVPMRSARFGKYDSTVTIIRGVDHSKLRERGVDEVKGLLDAPIISELFLTN